MSDAENEIDFNDTRMATLRTNDGQSIHVPIGPMLLSTLIRDQVEDEHDEDEFDLVFPQVQRQEDLQRVVDFCFHHVEEPLGDIPQPIPDDKNLSDVVSGWYADFANVDDVLSHDLYAETVEANKEGEMDGKRYVEFQNSFIESTADRENVPKWQNFVPVESFKKFSTLLSVADSMGITPLVNLLGAQCAVMIRGQSSEWLRVVLGPEFKLDFTAEEYAEVQEEFRWVE